jgi:hypothetical protein
MSRKKGFKFKIVFFALCGNSTKFLSLTTAQEAAEIHSHLVGYACEAFLCEKGCTMTIKGSAPKSVYHIRGKVRPTSTDANAFNRETRWSAESLASFRERKATAEKKLVPAPDSTLAAERRAEREEYVDSYRARHVALTQTSDDPVVTFC